MPRLFHSVISTKRGADAATYSDLPLLGKTENTGPDRGCVLFLSRSLISTHSFAGLLDDLRELHRRMF